MNRGEYIGGFVPRFTGGAVITVKTHIEIFDYTYGDEQEFHSRAPRGGEKQRAF